MPIRFKILAACLAMTAVTVALGLFSLRGERRLGELVIRTYDEAVMSISFVRAAETKFTAMGASLAVAEATTGPGAVPAPVPAQAADKPSERQRLIARARAGSDAAPAAAPAAPAAPAGAGVPQRTADRERIRAVLDDLDVAVDRAMSPEGRAAAAALRRRVAALGEAAVDGGVLDEVGKAFEEVVEAYATDGFAFRARAEESLGEAERGMLAAIAFSVLAAGLAGLALSHALVPPLVSVIGVMGQLAAGDNTVEVPGSGRRDEVGQMARAVQVFKDAAADKMRLEFEAAEQRRLAESERQRNEVGRAEAAAAQAAVVEAVAAGLERLAAGDLTYRLEQAFPVEFERLRGDFNAALERLQDAMRAVVANAEAIRSGTGEIAQASDDLSRRTEQQAASLEQTAATLDQITATVKRTAEGAKQAREAVSRTRADAERSGVVVRDAVASMDEIERSSQQVGRIIGVIDEIAFQTNLLALNAGVEAARAGEAGRGFAVVASEVRALAQRSAEAAKEIKALISASAEQVGAGARLVGETGQALERIVAQVGEVDGAVAEIAGSAGEQATGLAEVNTAVTRMDQVTQQNAAMVEESTAAVRALAQETEALARLAGRFRVGPGAGDAAPALGAAALRQPSPALPQARAAAAPPPRPVKRAVLEPAGAAAEEGWEEFRPVRSRP